MGLVKLFFLGGGGRWAGQGAAAGGGGPAAAPRARPRPPPRATQEQVAEELQKLPAELFAGREELEAMGVHELRERARTAGISVGRAIVERKELVEQLLQV